jgi:hypothetical protein
MRIIALAIVLSGLLMSWADSKESYAAEPTHPVATASAQQAPAAQPITGAIQLAR